MQGLQCSLHKKIIFKTSPHYVNKWMRDVDTFPQQYEILESRSDEFRNRFICLPSTYADL